jgi:hypothetical protein
MPEESKRRLKEKITSLATQSDISSSRQQ